MKDDRRAGIARLPNLGPVTERWLADWIEARGTSQGRLGRAFAAIGVHSRRDLEALGALNAYRLLKGHGFRVSLNLVYAIEAMLRDTRWDRLPVTVRNRLKAAVEDINRPRCDWPTGNALMLRYHDEEWGVPVHDDRKHFEFLTLEGAQAGLSWLTILKKRENYRDAFAGFDPRKVARFDKRKIRALLTNPGIVRNRLKVESTVSNAHAFLAVQKEFGSFDRYIWRFVGGKPIVNRRTSLKQLPALTKESDALSADLKKRGFRFVGSTVIYAHMQAAGLVNDHLVSCFRYRACRGGATGGQHP